MFHNPARSETPDRRLEMQQMAEGVEQVLHETGPVIEHLTALSTGQESGWSIEEVLSSAIEIKEGLQALFAWFKVESQREPDAAAMEAWFKKLSRGKGHRSIPEGAPTLEELRALAVRTDFSTASCEGN